MEFLKGKRVGINLLTEEALRLLPLFPAPAGFLLGFCWLFYPRGHRFGVEFVGQDLIECLRPTAGLNAIVFQDFTARRLTSTASNFT